MAGLIGAVSSLLSQVTCRRTASAEKVSTNVRSADCASTNFVDTSSNHNAARLPITHPHADMTTPHMPDKAPVAQTSKTESDSPQPSKTAPDNGSNLEVIKVLVRSLNREEDADSPSCRLMMDIVTSMSPEHLTKAARKARLRNAVLADDAESARSSAISIAQSWNGKGLHPLHAIRNLATFEGEEDTVMDIMFAVMCKYLVFAGWRTHEFWRSLSKGKGATNRYFKAFDHGLTRIIVGRWYSAMLSNKETGSWPSEILRRVHTFMHTLQEQRPDRGQETIYNIPDNRPINVVAAEGILNVAEYRCYWIMVTTKVAGDLLPQEVLNMIVDLMADRKTMMGILSHWKALSPRDDASHRIREGHRNHTAGQCHMCLQGISKV